MADHSDAGEREHGEGQKQESEGTARMELEADAWHQNEDGNHYIDCPECGSTATLSNVVNRGRCDGYLDQHESDTELDEDGMTCTASLSLELVYTSDPEASMADPDVGEDDGGSDRNGDSDQDVDIDDQASGTDSAPSND